MRIISENRLLDIPYEEFVLAAYDEKIVATKEPRDFIGFVVAHPETAKQAREVLNALQDAYLSGAKVVYMDYIMEEVRSECQQ